MAFTLDTSLPIDITDAASMQQSFNDALYYIFKTFLPARGFVTSEITSSKFTCQYPFTRISDGSDYTNYMWVQWTGTTTINLTMYEDATYTTVPGDLATDTTSTGTLTQYIYTDPIYATSPVKLWVSDEDNAMFMVTQGPRLHMWWEKPSIDVYEPAAHVSTGPSIDRFETQMFLHGSNTASHRILNLPYNTGISSTEETLYALVPSENYFPDSKLLLRGFPLRINDDPQIIGYVDRADVRIFSAEESVRTKTTGQAWRNVTMDTLAGVEDIRVYRINGTQYWAIMSTEVDGNGGIAFYMGTSQPDFS